jgi:hypothetical protein
MASWGEASQSRLIGKRITRLSGKDKVQEKQSILMILIVRECYTDVF